MKGRYRGWAIDWLRVENKEAEVTLASSISSLVWMAIAKRMYVFRRRSSAVFFVGAPKRDLIFRRVELVIEELWGFWEIVWGRKRLGSEMIPLLSLDQKVEASRPDCILLACEGRIWLDGLGC